MRRDSTGYSIWARFELGEASVSTWYACDGRPRLGLDYFSPWASPTRAYGGAAAAAADWLIAAGRVGPEAAVRTMPLIRWSQAASDWSRAPENQPVAEGTALIVPALVHDRTRAVRVFVRATFRAKQWHYDQFDAMQFPTWFGTAARR